MDKYQTNALTNIKLSCIGENNSLAKVLLDRDSLKIIQNENYNILKYDLTIEGKIIDKVEYFDGEWEKSDNYNGTYTKASNPSIHLVPVSFQDKRTQKIRIVFKGGLVDTVELTLNYQEADVESWNIKSEKKMIECYKKNMAVCSTEEGIPHFETLVVRPCSPHCKKTIVDWYLVVGGREAYYLSTDVITDKREYSNSPTIARETNGSPHLIRLSRELAFIIKQYDEKDNLLIEIKSDYLPKN